MNNGVKIMIMDGNNIKKEQEGRKTVQKFKGVFANSLLLMKLRELGLNEKVGKTRDIIGLEFVHKYVSLEAENKINEINNIKVDAKGLTNKIKELENVKKELKGGNKLSELNEEIRLEVKDIITQIKYLKEQRKSLNSNVKEKRIDVIENDIVSKKGIRKDLYNGFDLTFKDKDGNIEEIISYVFWFRSPSKTRVGDAVFINKKLFEKIDKWQRMGIELIADKYGNVKLIEMEAYKSLTSSAIEGTFVLDVKNILVLDDLTSFAEYECSVVDVYKKGEKKDEDGKDCEGQIYVKNGLYELANTLFDGQALGDVSIFQDKYENKGMIVGRQHFFKACILNTNIQLFMKDWCEQNNKNYDTYEVKDRYGNMIKVKDILLITTENSMKFEKFFDDKAEGYKAWCRAVKEDGNVFGIVKSSHESKYKKAGLQRMSYQQVNTLPISKDDVEELLKPTIEYINDMKGYKKIDNFIEYLEATKDNVNENEMLIDLYKRNNDFARSFLFTKQKRRIFDKLVNQKVRAGKIFVPGENLTVCGNPYTMLLHSVNKVPTLTKIVRDEEYNNVIDDKFKDITLPFISNKCICVYTKRFEDNEQLASFRNPHNAPNNIGYNVNHISKEMNTYFNFDRTIMAVNCIKTNEQDKKNSEDFDSDFNLVTNLEVICKASVKAQEFKTIVNNIPQKGKPYKNTLEELAKIDDGLGKAKNDIGISSNLAQIAMSWYWNYETEELADYVTILSVLAQCSIDGSKREYDVKIAKEIGRIRKNINDMLKEKQQTDDVKNLPLFWQYTNETILHKNSEEKTIAIKELINCDCPMDWIQEKIKIKGDSKKDRITDLDFIVNFKGKKNKTMYNKVVSSCEEYTKENNRIHKELDKAERDIDKEKLNNEMAILNDDLLKNIADVKLGTNRKPIIDKNKIKELINNAIDKNLEIEELEEELEKLIDETIITNTKKNEIAQKTMEMLIASCLAIKGENRDYKLIMLKMLYKTHKKSFLNCFMKK
ncbi:hypothetical protein FC758_01255 [Clostridium botulinum]|nr:hypothetical protein [Clostridium botulinum]